MSNNKDDKVLGMILLTVIALTISFLVIKFYPVGWKDWVVILASIIGAIGGLITGRAVSSKA